MICKLYGRIGHKAYSCIIHGTKCPPPSIRIKTNQLNHLHGDEPTDKPIEWNIQPPEAHFKSRISPPQTSLVVSAIMGIINNHAIDNGYVEVLPSYFPVESNSESVTDSDTTPIISIDYDKMEHLL